MKNMYIFQLNYGNIIVWRLLAWKKCDQNSNHNFTMNLITITKKMISQHLYVISQLGLIFVLLENQRNLSYHIRKVAIFQQFCQHQENTYKCQHFSPAPSYLTFQLHIFKDLISSGLYNVNLCLHCFLRIRIRRIRIRG